MTDNLEVRCTRCGGVITHYCGQTLHASLKKLYSFVLEDTYKETFQENKGYEEGDEKAPFFSESFLYNLLGKEDARTVLACLRNFITSMGIDPATPRKTPGCHHALTRTIAWTKDRKAAAKWCGTCGAIQYYNDKGKPEAWEMPADKEPKP